MKALHLLCASLLLVTARGEEASESASISPSPSPAPTLKPADALASAPAIGEKFEYKSDVA